MIRYYKKEDIEQIAKIITDDWKKAYKGIIENEYLEKLDYKKKAKSIEEKYEKQKSIVYEENNIIQGYCRFGINRDEEKNYGEIYALYISYNQRKKGIGKELLKKAMDILKERSYKEILIWCLEENKEARKFYEKMGRKIIQN